MRLRAVLLVFVLMMPVSTAFAHVTLRPKESTLGATETYTMRVPTEGTVATTSVDLEVPEGVTIVSVAGPAAEHALKRTGDRITGLTWKVEIAPGQAREFSFVVRNPSAGSEIAWKAHQRYADGTSRDWVEAAGSRSPAAVTKLAPGR
jgi:uncharacterized protein YcnI